MALQRHPRETNLRPLCTLGLLAAMLAGCTKPTARPDEPGNPQIDQEPVAEALQGAGWLNSTFTTLQARGLTFNVEGDNCVLFRAPGFDVTVDRILDGFVEVQWTSPNPLLREMALFVHGETLDPGTRGASPLRVQLHNVTAHPELGIRAFLRAYEMPSVDYEVNMTLEWSIRYLGKPGPQVGTGSCG